MNYTIQNTIVNFTWGIADNVLLYVYARFIKVSKLVDEIAKEATEARE